MASQARNARNKRQGSPSQVNLVSARSGSHAEVRNLSRRNAADGYAQLRKKRTRKKSILMGAGIVLASLFVAAVAAVAVYTFIINKTLGTDLHGNQTNFSQGVWEGVFVPPGSEADPFWVLLLGTDDRDGDLEYSRTDTIILVRVDQANKTLAMISIPRDTYVNIPGYGKDKINAAYSYGEQAVEGGGIPLTIKTVSEFAGVQITYFIQVNFDGLIRLVDHLGGVDVDVPVDIIGDTEAGDIDLYEGLQTLDGYAALYFCRSRDFMIGDYQRTANQRTFLQALTKQVLASDPATIAVTVKDLADMCYTNLDVGKIIRIAQSYQGMRENAIHTYYVPSETKPISGISYVIAYDYEFWLLIEAIEKGNYPPPQDDSFAGIVPDAYVASAQTAEDKLGGKKTNIKTSDYIIDVRNGGGIPGSARSVSDMLTIAGYQYGDVGNTNAFIYDQTLIIYAEEENRPVAEDIRQRLGYGRIVSSKGAYEFSGHILVVIGKDFQ